MSKLDDCTFLVKTFLRPASLCHLLVSIHRYYPGTAVIVVDDSNNGETDCVCSAYDNVRLVKTEEFDVGISRGRNIGLDLITTPYFVLLDDDVAFWALSDLPYMRKKLEESGADIVCGSWCDLPGTLFTQTAMVFKEFGDQGEHIITEAPLPYGGDDWVDFGNNFFIARTELRETVRWPDAIKVMEHAPYFWYVKQQGKRVWTTNRSSIAHLPRRNQRYVNYRLRYRLRKNSSTQVACRQFEQQHKVYFLEPAPGSSDWEKFANNENAFEWGLHFTTERITKNRRTLELLLELYNSIEKIFQPPVPIANRATLPAVKSFSSALLKTLGKLKDSFLPS